MRCAPPVRFRRSNSPSSTRRGARATLYCNCGNVCCSYQPAGRRALFDARTAACPLRRVDHRAGARTVGAQGMAPAVHLTTPPSRLKDTVRSRAALQIVNRLPYLCPTSCDHFDRARELQSSDGFLTPASFALDDADMRARHSAAAAGATAPLDASQASAVKAIAKAVACFIFVSSTTLRA